MGSLLEIRNLRIHFGATEAVRGSMGTGSI